MSGNIYLNLLQNTNNETTSSKIIYAITTQYLRGIGWLTLTTNSKKISSNVIAIHAKYKEKAFRSNYEG